MGDVTSKVPLYIVGGGLAAGAVIYLVTRSKEAKAAEPKDSEEPAPKPGPKPKQLVGSVLQPTPKEPEPEPQPEEPSVRSPTDLSDEEIYNIVEVVRKLMPPPASRKPQGYTDWTREVVGYAVDNYNVDPAARPQASASPKNWPEWTKQIREKIRDYAISKTADDTSDLYNWFNRTFNDAKRWKKPGKDRSVKGVLQDLLKEKKRKEKWWPWAGEGAGSGTVADYIYNWAFQIVQDGLPLLWLNGPRAFMACPGSGADEARCMATDMIIEEALGLPGPKGDYGQLDDKQRNEFIETKSPKWIANWFYEPWDHEYWAGVPGSIQANTGQRARIYDAAVYQWPTLLARYARYNRYRG